MSERSVPFHCPYCGDTDLRPHGAQGGEWECRSCLRAFSLRLKGLIRPAAQHSAGQAPGTGSEKLS